MSRWQPNEIAVLRAHYPKGQQADVLKALPGRSLRAIEQKASKLRISRKGARDPGSLCRNPIMRQLAEIRDREMLTLRQVGSSIGISKATVHAAEWGKHSPSIDTVTAWAEVLGHELRLVKKGSPEIRHVQRLLDRVEFQDLEGRIMVDRSPSARMTRREMALLRHMIEHSPHLRTKEQLHFALYGDAEDGGAEAKIVDVWICKIRAKILGLPIEIKTLWGQGYGVVET